MRSLRFQATSTLQLSSQEMKMVVTTQSSSSKSTLSSLPKLPTCKKTLQRQDTASLASKSTSSSWPLTAEKNARTETYFWVSSLLTRTMSTSHLIWLLSNPSTQVGVCCSALTTWSMSSNTSALSPAPKTKTHLTNKSNQLTSSLNSPETSSNYALVNVSQEMCLLIVLSTSTLMMKCSLMIKTYPSTTARCRRTLETHTVFRLRP